MIRWLLAVVVVSLPVSVSAQCDFDAPGKARGLKSDMVRAFVPCGTGVTFPSPNTAGSSGTPGCTPPTAYSDFVFASNGRCSLKMNHKLESPCGTGTPGDCSILTVTAKCSGIMQADGVTPISGPGWALNIIQRVTRSDDGVAADRTVIDATMQFTFEAASKGKLRLKSDSHDYFLGFISCFAGFSGCPDFRACTSIESISAKILDPSGAVFATLGSSTR